MANIKNLIGKALNRAKISSNDDGSKKKKTTTTQKMKTKGYSQIPSKTTNPSSLSYLPAQEIKASPKEKTIQDYKNERKNLKQEFRTEKLKAKQEKKLEDIYSGKRPDISKAATTGITLASSALGVAEGIKKLLKKED